MPKPNIAITDEGIKGATLIQTYSGLDKAEWKEFLPAIKHFISENEDATAKTPRSWKKSEWVDLARQFLDEFEGAEDETRGEKYFHHARAIDKEKNFVWPEDKEMCVSIHYSL